MSQYRFGTVAVTNGSPAVVGVGTLWASNAAAGNLFSLLGQGVWYTILSVTDDTHLTLASNFVGATVTAASYGIQRNFTPIMNYPTPSFGDQDTSSLIAQTLLQLDAQMSALSPVMQALNGVINVTGAISVSGTILNASTALTLTNPRTITLSGPVTGVVSFDGSQNVSIATTITNLGAANGVATLDSNGKVPVSQINASLIGALNYQGAWNAATNTPSLVSGAGTKGFYYKVSTAGSTLIDGVSQWNVNDLIAFDGTVWDKFDGISSEVFSVAGRTGSVTLTSSDLTDSTTVGRALLTAATIAAQKNALSITSGDVSGLMASATTDTTNASNISSGTLPVARLPIATSSAAGAVITGANITNTAGTLSITSANVVAALGLTPFSAAGGTISGAVTISSLLSAASLTVSGDTTLTGTLAAASLIISGNTTLTGTLAVTGGISAASLPLPTSTTVGGVKSATAVTGQLMSGISIAGDPTFATAPVGFRNRIINGDMRVAQRGASFAIAGAGYALDRWFISSTGTAPTFSQVSGPTGYKNALQITGIDGNTLAVVAQRIESYNTTDLAGGSVTISANLSASVAQTVTWSLFYPTAVDTFGTNTIIATGTWSITTSAANYTAVISGLPAGAANGLQLNIYPNSGGAFTSGTFTVTGVQLEPGSIATPFERRPIGVELALCQRYYQQSSFPTTSTFVTSSGWGTGLSFSLPVTMRSAPSQSIITTPTLYTCTLSTNSTTPNSASWTTISTMANTNVGFSGGIYGLSAEI